MSPRTFRRSLVSGEEPLWPRFKAGDKTTSGLTLNSVWENIQSRARSQRVFIKDFPHYINHLWNPEFLSHFKHAFLIRDPAKTLTSMYKQWPDFNEGEVGFPEQRALFDLLWALDDSPPPVIDSDDLLENPVDITRAYCEAMQIPFLPDALSWEPSGNAAEHSWWDGGSFHQNLANSTGLRPQPRRYVSLESTPFRVKQVYKKMKPHYDRLHLHRIKV